MPDKLEKETSLTRYPEQFSQANNQETNFKSKLKRIQ